MKKMTTSAMVQTNGGKKYYRVYDNNCGRNIYVTSYSEWKAHSRRKGHWNLGFNSMARADWMNREVVYL